MLESIHVTVRFDKTLQKITEMADAPAMMSKDAPFVFLLHCILTDYPKIKKKYPPGKLCFVVNGVAPETDYELQDGDEVWFGVA